MYPRGYGGKRLRTGRTVWPPSLVRRREPSDVTRQPTVPSRGPDHTVRGVTAKATWPDGGRLGTLGDDDSVPPATLTSEALFARAKAVTPGGVNSPVRAFNAVGGTPRFMRSGHGAWLTDVDGREYVDLVCSWGPMLLGHAHPAVQEAVLEAVGPRDVVRHPDRARGRARRGDRRAHAGREGAPGQLGHRGDHVGDPARPRLHRPRRGREVRRLLPRPRRRAARLGRLGPGDLRGPGQLGRPGVVDGPHAGPALQRPRGGRGGVRRARRPDRVPDHRGGPGQHGRRPAGAGASTRFLAETCRRTARCSSATR